MAVPATCAHALFARWGWTAFGAVSAHDWAHGAWLLEPKPAEVLAALEWDCRMGINTLIARLTGVSRQAVNERLKLLSLDKRQSLGFKHKGFVSSDYRYSETLNPKP